MNNQPYPAALPTRVSDIEFQTVMDTGFFGNFAMTPAVHSHPYYEMIADIEGDFRIELIDGQCCEMHSGSVCIIPPTLFHSTNGCSGMPRKLAVRFTYKYFNNGELLPLFECFDRALTSVKQPLMFDCPIICNLMVDIRKEIEENNIGSDVLTDSLLRQLYVTMIRQIGDSRAAVPFGSDAQSMDDSRNSRYYRIEIYFAENLSRQITEDDLAAELSLSKRQLSRVLREIYGKSFREKLIENRLHAAARLLSGTDMPIENIARMVGYTSVSGFYMRFKKEFGMSGSEYRQKMTYHKPV